MSSTTASDDDKKLQQVEIENQPAVQRFIGDVMAAVSVRCRQRGSQLSSTHHWLAPQRLCEKGADINMNVSNLKLALMAVACAAAVLTHFNGMDFPDNRWVIGAAIAAYVVISAVLQLVSWLWEEDTICRTLPGKVGAVQLRLLRRLLLIPPPWRSPADGRVGRHASVAFYHEHGKGQHGLQPPRSE